MENIKLFELCQIDIQIKHVPLESDIIIIL